MVPPEKVNEVIGQVDDSDFISIDIDLRMYRSAQSEFSVDRCSRSVPCSVFGVFGCSVFFPCGCCCSSSREEVMGSSPFSLSDSGEGDGTVD